MQQDQVAGWRLQYVTEITLIPVCSLVILHPLHRTLRMFVNSLSSRCHYSHYKKKRSSARSTSTLIQIIKVGLYIRYNIVT